MNKDSHLIFEAWQRGSGSIKGTEYAPAIDPTADKPYYSILLAIREVTNDPEEQSSLAAKIVEMAFDKLEDIFKRLAIEPDKGFEKGEPMAIVAYDWRQHQQHRDKKDRLDALYRWAGKHAVRPAIVEVIPDTKHKEFITKDKFAARGIMRAIMSTGAIEPLGAETEISKGANKRSNKLDSAEQQVKQEISKDAPAPVRTSRFDPRTTYEVNAPTKTLSASARKVMDQMIDVGDEFAGSEFIKRIADWYFDGKSGPAQKIAMELLSAGALAPAMKRSAGGDADDPFDTDVEYGSDHDAQKYARSHFGDLGGSGMSMGDE